MLSRDCDGCPQLRECSRRYQKVVKGEKVHCPDGTAHLVDESSIYRDIDPCNVCLEASMIRPASV